MSGNDNKSTDKTLLLTANHNYFVRQAISTFCGLVILTFIYAFIAIMCSSTIIEGLRQQECPARLVSYFFHRSYTFSSLLFRFPK